MIFCRLIYFVLSISIVCINTSSAQTIIFSDAGPFSYTGIDVPATENFNADISNCTSVSISYDFEFSLPWEGSGNMESCDECPGCPCDPNNPLASGCTPCWDYLYGVMQIDGSTVFENLIGDVGTTNADQSGTISSGYFCTDGASSIDLELQTNTWAGDETSTFSNIVIMCYQATAVDIITEVDLCAGQDVTLEGEAFTNADVDTWIWSTDGGSIIDNDAIQNTFASGATDGETYTLITSDINGCTSSISETISIDPSPTASIDQTSEGELCFGECTTIKFNFAGGEAPYDLSLTFSITGIGFPINFNAPGFQANDGITVCYDVGGILPSYDPSSQTIHVPELAGGFSSEFLLNSFTDNNGCDGIVGGMGFSISFLNTPVANYSSLEKCDEGGGFATFDLTEMDDEVNGGSGETVTYYDDPGLTNEVFSPYISPSSVLYATVSNADCTSDAQVVDLIVLDNGDAGIVEVYCTDIGSTECTLCDDDGNIGEMVTIIFVFNDPSLQHIVKLNYTDATGSTEATYTLNPNQTSLAFTISSLTTIELLEVTEGDDCIDNTDLGDIITINYLMQPELDPIGPLTDCGSITLPEITGTNLSGTELYYTETNQGGDSYAAGAAITSSVDLYVYSGLPDCYDEIMVEVEILPGTTFDEPNDTTSCGPYTLPEITGIGINSTAAYYTLSGGNGNIYIPGNTVLSSTTLFIYDPMAPCQSNEPSFDIMIFDTPDIYSQADIDTCGIYELPVIEGVILSGNQAYYTEPNGMGTQLMVGDTIFQSDTIYAYDNNNGCSDEEEIKILIGTGPTAGVGDTLSICKSGSLVVSLPDLLVSPADTAGIWSDDSGIITMDTDSTLVDLTNAAGTINFMYVIENIECGNDTSHLQLSIVEQVDLGEDEIIFRCGDENIGNIDLDEYWNITGVDDTIVVAEGMGISVQDVNNVALIDLDPGLYVLQYIVGVKDSICQKDTVSLGIQIEDAPDAGIDVSTSTCLGNFVDLESLLQDNNTVGTFGDPNLNGGLVGNMVDTGVLGSGNFTFTHTVDPSGNCPGETISITIEITNEVTAGEDVDTTICSPGMISLIDLIDDQASTGGVFFNPNDDSVIPNGILDANVPGLYIVGYKVGDGITCPVSTSTLTIIVLQEPIIDIEAIDSLVCDSILHVEINYDFIPDFDITVIIDGPLAELPIIFLIEDIQTSNGTIQREINLNTNLNLPQNINFTIYIDQVMRGDCVYDIQSIPDTFTIGRMDTLLINDILCEDGSITIEDQVFDIDNSSGEIIIERQNDCDSLILVDLTFVGPATNFINNTLCFGESLSVNNTIYDQTNPTGQETIIGGSSNGCDSIITVELMFADASYYEVMQSICPGEELIFNNMVYDENNLIGSETIIGGSAGGCDSIINVNLTLNPATSYQINESTCEPDFSIEVNGTIYNILNSEGSETIVGGSANGCDSIINVSIIYESIAITYYDIQPMCEETEGMLIITDIVGSAPYSYLISSDPLIEITAFPDTIANLTGSGVIEFFDADGCETMLNYDFTAPQIMQLSYEVTDMQILVTSNLPNEITEIVWTPTTGLSCIDCLNPTFTTSEDAVYTVEVYYGEGCSESLDIFIEGETPVEIPDYTIPNIFSPNGDGNNDIFFIQPNQFGSDTIASMIIYDRWGNQVYSRENYITANNIGWDGTYKGKEVNPGVFVYVIQVLEGAQVKTIVGDVSIVK